MRRRSRRSGPSRPSQELPSLSSRQWRKHPNRSPAPPDGSCRRGAVRTRRVVRRGGASRAVSRRVGADGRDRVEWRARMVANGRAPVGGRGSRRGRVHRVAPGEQSVRPAGHQRHAQGGVQADGRAGEDRRRGAGHHAAVAVGCRRRARHGDCGGHRASRHSHHRHRRPDARAVRGAGRASPRSGACRFSRRRSGRRCCSTASREA